MLRLLLHITTRPRKQKTANVEEQLATEDTASTANSMALTPTDVRQKGVFENFERFPSLPLEMQRSIWRYAASVPRVIPFTNDIKPLALEPSTMNTFLFFLQASKASQPAILQVCHEARREVLLEYQLILGTQFVLAKFQTSSTGDFQLLRKDGSVWFNYDVDVLYLSLRFCPNIDHYVGEVLEYWDCIGTLAIDAEMLHQGSPGSRGAHINVLCEWKLLRLLRHCNAIKDIIIVIQDQVQPGDNGAWQFGKLLPKHGEWELVDLSTPYSAVEFTYVVVITEAYKNLRDIGKIGCDLLRGIARWPRIAFKGVAKGDVRL